MTMHKERRKHQRYRTKDGVFIISNNQIGTVRDISKGGIAFKYLNSMPAINSTIDIFSAERNFHIKEVPLRLIKDHVEDATPPYASIQMRKCAGEYANISQQHEQELEYFISLLAVEGIPHKPTS